MCSLLDYEFFSNGILTPNRIWILVSYDIILSYIIMGLY